MDLALLTATNVRLLARARMTAALGDSLIIHLHKSAMPVLLIVTVVCMEKVAMRINATLAILSIQHL